MAKRAALRPDVVEDGAPASLQVAGPQRQELRPAKPRQHGGYDDGVVSRPCRRLGDSIEKALKLVGIESLRSRLLGLGAPHIVGGVALYETHPASEVVEAAERGESHADGRRRRHLPGDAGPIGEGVELGGRRVRGVVNACEEALDIAGVLLGCAGASGAPMHFRQVCPGDGSPVAGE